MAGSPESAYRLLASARCAAAIPGTKVRRSRAVRGTLGRTGSSRIGAHSSEELRVTVWPWLQKQELATAEDDPVLGEFLIRLSKLKRPAHLRAGLNARRKWSTDEVASASAEELESNIRDAVNTLLGSIGEPSFLIVLHP